jgi:hypothetical protein
MVKNREKEEKINLLYLLIYWIHVDVFPIRGELSERKSSQN